MYAFGSINALGALEGADSFLSAYGFLRAEGLHSAVVGEVVAEAVHLQPILLMHVSLPALKPLVVH